MRQQQLSPQDWQLLSAYLDGQLSERERENIESRLNSQAEFTGALEEMRKTRAMLRSVQKQRVPHNFTLTPAMVQQVRPHPLLRFLPVLNFASAAAALAVIVLLVVNLLPGTVATPAAAPLSIPAAAPVENQGAQSGPTIQWSSPGGYGGGGGSGGGGADSSTGTKSLGSPDTAIGMGGGGGSGPGFTLPPQVVENLPTSTGQQQKALQSDPTAPASGSSASEQNQPPPSDLPLAQPTPGLVEPLAPAAAAPIQATPAPTNPSTAVAAAPSEPLSGSGPILGARSAQEAQAENQQATTHSDQYDPAPQAARFPLLAVILLSVLALAAALTAILIRRVARS